MHHYPCTTHVHYTCLLRHPPPMSTTNVLPESLVSLPSLSIPASIDTNVRLFHDVTKVVIYIPRPPCSLSPSLTPSPAPQMVPKESPYFVEQKLKDPECFPPTKARHVRHRQSVKEIVRPRDAEFYDVVKRMLRVDPDERITAKEALSHPFFSEMKSSIASASLATASLHTSIISSRVGNSTRPPSAVITRSRNDRPLSAAIRPDTATTNNQ